MPHDQNNIEIRPMQFVPGADTLPQLDNIFERATNLPIAQSLLLGRIAMGFSTEETAELRGVAISTIRNTQASIGEALGMGGSVGLLAVAAHASGWFAEAKANYAEDELPYSKDVFREGLGTLSRAPLRVLRLRASGFSVANTAEVFHISPKTIKNHQEKLLEALLPATAGKVRTMHTVVAASWLEGLMSAPGSMHIELM